MTVGGRDGGRSKGWILAYARITGGGKGRGVMTPLIRPDGGEEDEKITS
jgi:hypothetical protein